MQVTTRSLAKKMGVNNDYVIAIAHKLHVKVNTLAGTISQWDFVRLRDHIADHLPLDKHHEDEVKDKNHDAMDDYFECITNCDIDDQSCHTDCVDDLKAI